MRNYLIWSNQHGMWWRPAERGYTASIELAGRYPYERAAQIVDQAAPDGGKRYDPETGQSYYQPAEVLVLAPEELDTLGAAVVDVDRDKYPHRCPGCGKHYRTAEVATRCDADHRGHAARISGGTFYGFCEVCGELGNVRWVKDPDQRVPQAVCLDAQACGERCAEGGDGTDG